MNTPLLNWLPGSNGGIEAQLGSVDDGVLFSLARQPTCYRRGQYRLLVEVCGGPNHFKWGCFDEADQPTRYFHREENARDEAEAIAHVLWKDRQAKP